MFAHYRNHPTSRRPIASTLRMSARRVIAALVLLAAALLWAPSAALAAGNFQSVGGFAIYLGVVPSEMVQGHPVEHPEPKMHGGAPAKREQQHVVIAVFEALSGARIEDAVVTAKVTELGFTRNEKRLEPMPIAGAMSYGNYFAMPAKGPYRIDVRVMRPATGKTVDATFMYTLPR